MSCVGYYFVAVLIAAFLVYCVCPPNSRAKDGEKTNFFRAGLMSANFQLKMSYAEITQRHQNLKNMQILATDGCIMSALGPHIFLVRLWFVVVTAFVYCFLNLLIFFRVLARSPHLCSQLAHFSFTSYHTVLYYCFPFCRLSFELTCLPCIAFAFVSLLPRLPL